MIPIVTLLSDFGLRDYRVAALKGAIWSAIPIAQLTDISHDIHPFDIDEAAFLLRSCYHRYPPGTIHIVNVLNYGTDDNRLIYFKHDGQHFIGPNNGLFSLVFDQLGSLEVYRLVSIENQHYTYQAARIIQILLNEDQPHEQDVELVNHPVQKLRIQPVVTDDELRTSVIHIDRYGNVVLNVDRETFESNRGGRAFSLFINRHERIHEISEHYMEVEIGSPLCSFNDLGLMEISVNLQRASDMLGLKKGDAVQIKFDPT